MRFRLGRSLQTLTMTLAVSITGTAAWADNETPAADGKLLFDMHCAKCHGGWTPDFAYPKEFLQGLPAHFIHATLTEGAMRRQGDAMTADERQTVAEYLSGGSIATPPPEVSPTCSDTTVSVGAIAVAAWGINARNERAFSASTTSINADNVAQLELAWAIRVPDAFRARSQPAVAHGNLFFGTQNNGVVAVDEKTGCVRWEFDTVAEVRTAIVADPDPETPYLYFGDIGGNIYAIDALSGKLVWRDQPNAHPLTLVTAAPALHDGKLYVSVSSIEVGAAADPSYECCDFRGGVTAYEASTGTRLWQTHTIPEEPQPVGDVIAGKRILAPSGAPIWNTPSIDAKRNRLYVGTGENYSSPAEGHSDAIIAMDLTTGEVAWVQQMTEKDAWNVSCELEIDVNCPEEDGPDYDFGAATIVHTRSDGKDVVLAGQKSGQVYALDPDNGGDILWENKLGRGGIQGGVHFGMAVDNDALYVPMSDFYGGPRWPGEAQPGMFRVNTLTGETEWFTKHENNCEGRKYCEPGISAPATAIPGAVVAGAMDGLLRAYDAETGEVIWSFDTDRDFEALGGHTGDGGSVSGASGPVFVDDMMYITSGYGLYQHMAGNVLLAFKLRGADETVAQTNPGN
ncbi:pyrrolo-quinoline quinone [Luminiphilus syltensis NOR5-1B]|uniref:Pyrrolo-quinoline quinone n=1 Tax=Luminiphilus syltensis NOR5-1B TaxID=565045 RepID=B8KQH3_9GAMM|nr:pyrrolo-quinoline quinone [Luminiphilus syltensis NOR5-1B]